MSEPVESLREQLRLRGYLSHGIERWFARDPWSSRTFWTELFVVAAKAAAVIAVFAALPHTALMVVRNRPLGVIETLELFVLYGAAWFVLAAAFVVAIALALKIRPQLPIDTPRALLAVSIVASAAIAGAVAAWWFAFDSEPAASELLIGMLLIGALFVVATIVVSAALLSFSIYELQRIPAIHQRRRTLPLAVAAGLLIALLFVPAIATPDIDQRPPVQVVTAPTDKRVTFVAIDGLTWDLLRSRPDLIGQFLSAGQVPPVPARSAAERWATIGTGVPSALHGVRSITAVQLAGGRHILQSVSHADFILGTIAPAVGIARLQPLPPTARRRDYIWEILAGRGLTSVAVNWWASNDESHGALTSIGQGTIFGAARGDALRVDAIASRRLLAAVDQQRPQFATVYLPALDVLLNRLRSDPSAQLANATRALDGITDTVRRLRGSGYDVLLLGLPGELQRGNGVVAATFPIDAPKSASDPGVTLLELLGYPLSAEMLGKPLAGSSSDPRIPTYGTRSSGETQTKLNDEYYESLKSLGYIR